MAKDVMSKTLNSPHPFSFKRIVDEEDGHPHPDDNHGRDGHKHRGVLSVRERTGQGAPNELGDRRRRNARNDLLRRPASG